MLRGLFKASVYLNEAVSEVQTDDTCSSFSLFFFFFHLSVLVSSRRHSTGLLSSIAAMV